MSQRRVSFFAAISLLLLLAGCGGGGSNGGNDTDFTAVADWTNFGTPISGSSMSWKLFRANGTLLQGISINRNLAPIESVKINDIPDGTYHLEVELYTGPDLTGSLVGVIDEEISIQGSLSYTAAIGTDPSSVKVTPESATIEAAHQKQFYAAAYNAAGKATFVAPGTFDWSTLGGVATVDDDGLVLANSVGNGSVIATHTPSSLSDGATLTVQSNVTTGKWTVIVFLNAVGNLNEFGDINVNQMERVAGNSNVRFVVQWKQIQSFSSPNPSFVGTRRYLIKPDTTSAIESELVQNMGNGVDMGVPETMHDFINWAKTYYPAQRYCLVVWNHGNGWRRGKERGPTRAVSYDDETGNAIQTWELAQALGSNDFDILAWDASLMQMLEVAHEVQDHADYIAGSEESPPGAGYPYHLVFEEFRDNPDQTTLNLSRNFVDKTIEFYQSAPNENITQSVIDTNMLPALKTQIDNLATVLTTNVGTLGTLVPNVRATAKSFSPTSERIYRDLWDVCNRLQTGTSIVDLQNACIATKAAIEAAVKWEGHNTTSNGSHGISIDFSSAVQFADDAADYGLLRFSNESLWNEWLTVAP